MAISNSCGLSYSNCQFLSPMTFVLYQTASFFHLICNVRSLTSDTLVKKRMEQQISGAHQMRSCKYLYSCHPLVILVKWESCDYFLSWTRNVGFGSYSFITGDGGHCPGSPFGP